MLDLQFVHFTYIPAHWSNIRWWAAPLWQGLVRLADWGRAPHMLHGESAAETQVALGSQGDSGRIGNVRDGGTSKI